ncbi:hypothetical protein LPJ66_000671 [Kickxella alabastrina]|uniref:Uncharacterized protein n=1 Tax=Kickxella alabastrina TaxID=61397 RepID=A0ACC1IVF5_9FUNG|nr:hypothetical protein LPJ66_000671 [Kickxella alabastrina]
MLTQGLLVAQDWWLREWVSSYGKPSPTRNQLIETQQSGSKNGKDRDSSRVDLAHFIGEYVAIALASLFLILGRSLLHFWGSLKASRTLHEVLLHTILRAPVRFFDITPVGRLINRFSKDMESIDQSLISSLAIFLAEIIASLAILIVIAVITPAFTLGAIAIAIIYWVIGALYLATSREIKHFESVTKSPIYSQFGETINGVSTIRAYGQESRFRMANYTRVDDNNRNFIYMWGASRWLSIRVDLAGALVSFMAGLLALITTDRMDAGLAGLSLSYALNFTDHIMTLVWYYSASEINLNSVERVVEYLNIEPEAPVTIPDRVPPVEWPADGRISVENLELKYAENQSTCDSRDIPREKVGIVGRTGAGKSTLTLAMFKFMEASVGRIMVDGIDISQIGVGDLRSRLTIIPQDPILFTGTIRSNLDPFNEHGDDELWLALRRAHLLGDEDEIASRQSVSGNRQYPVSSRANTVKDLAIADNMITSSRSSSISQYGLQQTSVTLGRTITDLDMAVTENGSNFSQGQRQLIALARALVKRTRVIILDEATASVDFDTDACIQTTIRNEFADSTLLCIAHRLRTIVDYDKVLVLDQGEIVEYDTPYNLLSKGEGLFKHMCLKSGEYDHLFSAAERKHHSGTNEAILSV